MRAILAILIALSLTLAPVTSATAAMQMRASMDAGAVSAQASDDAMSDCMKAMQAHDHGTTQTSNQDCPCCDAPSKAACPDAGACLAKCSAHVIAILQAGPESRFAVVGQYRPSDPQKPPDWTQSPPAPPPRA